MLIFLKIIYNLIFIPFLKLVIKFNNHFKKNNRDNSIINLYKYINNISNEKKRIWFHASSMGEFEQAKPIIELLKEQYKEVVIICTFFSPSGYENQKYYQFADFTSYIPIDSKKNAKEFIDNIKPDLAVFVRYDLWINMFKQLKLDGAKIFLINATIPGSYFKFYFKYFKSYFNYAYSFIDDIYCFNQESFNYFKTYNLNLNLLLSSDTRLDRISQIVSEAKKSKNILVKLRKSNVKYLVAGSSWEHDENLIIKAVNEVNNDSEQIKVIFVPHKPTEDNISRLSSQLNNSILYSKIEIMSDDEFNNLNFSHIIVDKMGILLKLYSIADIAYVGCGFGDGVHSTAEPAGYGIPIISGPNIQKSPDAVQLQKNGGLILIENEIELKIIIQKLISDDSFYNLTCKQSLEYINQNIGSSEHIVSRIGEAIYGYK